MTTAMSNPTALKDLLGAALVLLELQMKGTVASGSSDTGDAPVKVGAVYNAALQTFTTGNVTDLQSDINGYLKSALKSYNSGISADEVATVNRPPRRQSTPQNLLSAAQAIDNTFTDVGAEVNCAGYDYVSFGIAIDIGTSVDVQFQALLKNESGGTEEYNAVIANATASTIKVEPEVVELNSDTDQLIVLRFATNGLPFMQLQIKDSADGDGELDSCYYTLAVGGV